MKKILFLSGLFLLSLCAFVYLKQGTPKPQPNIVIILMDDLGGKDLSIYGNKDVQTPNLEQIANSSLVFDNAFLTTSSCTPSRASLLTGLYPTNTGAPNLLEPLPAEIISISERLSTVGYYTAAAGKWHLGDAAMKKFDYLDVTMDVRLSGTEAWLKTLATRPENQPFFLWLASIDPHDPYYPETISQKHDPQEISLPAYLPDTPKVRERQANYYDEITRVDQAIGDFFEELKKQGLLDNTLVFILSDNGAPVPRAKATLYDSGIKTPLIVHYPSLIKQAERKAELVSSVDIVPTILAAAGLPTCETCDGESFYSLLAGEAFQPRKAVFAEQNHHGKIKVKKHAVRTHEHLYIVNAEIGDQECAKPYLYIHASRAFPQQQNKMQDFYQQCLRNQAPAAELYNVVTDPDNRKNLLDTTPSDAVFLKELKSMMAGFQQRIQYTPEKIN